MLFVVLIVALCLGMAVYLVWPTVRDRDYAAEAGRAISRKDLGPDDQKRFDDYVQRTPASVVDPLTYSMLLYMHSAAGGRAFSAERAPRIAFGYAIAILITTLLMDWPMPGSGLTELVQSMQIVLVSIGALAFTKFIWSERFVRWLRGVPPPGKRP